MKRFLALYDREKNELRMTSLIRLPLTEKYLCKKSEEIYKQQYPDIKQKTEIARMFGEKLKSELEKMDDLQGVLNISRLNDIFKGAVQFPKGAKYGRFIQKP